LQAFATFENILLLDLVFVICLHFRLLFMQFSLTVTTAKIIVDMFLLVVKLEIRRKLLSLIFFLIYIRLSHDE
jgi:hypothetical protein